MSLIKKIKFPNETIYDIGSKWSNIDKENIVYEPSEMVSFENNKIESLKKCIINIKAVQEGSGDPSPENVRPITGWTGANVQRCGKNLFDPSVLLIQSDNYSVNDDGSITVKVSNTSAWDWLPEIILPPGIYTISRDKNIGNTSVRDITANAGIAFMGDGTTAYSSTFTVIEGHVVKIRLASGAQSYPITVNIQIEIGSTATAYEPYQGTTYPIAFPAEAGTVYGGTLDVLKGELVVTHKSVVLTGESSEYWYVYDPTNYDAFCFASSFEDKKIGESLSVCNEFHNVKNAWGAGGNGVFGVFSDHSTLNRLYFRQPYAGFEKSVSAWIAWLADHPLEIIYPLANPVIYQLTPKVISSLLGQNNIWADCGDMSIELENFYSDIQTEITTNLNENTLLYKSNNLLISSNILIENDNLYFSKLNTYSPPQISVSLNSDNKTYRNMDIGWTYSLGNGAVLGLREEHFPNTPGAFFLCARRTLIENENTSILTTQFRGTPEGSITISNNDNTVCLNINTSTSTTINPKDYNLYVNGTSYLKGDTKISANTSTVGCTLQYDDTLNTLNFVFD